MSNQKRVKNKNATTSRRVKSISNSEDFKTYGIIIILEQVRDVFKRDELRKTCSATPKNANAVFVNARAYNYFELLVWLKENYGMTTKNVCDIRPKVYTNRLTKVDIDLTKIESKGSVCNVNCKVDEQRNIFELINKQVPLFKANHTRFIERTFTTKDKYSNLAVNFYSSVINSDNSQTKTQIPIDCDDQRLTIGESSSQVRVRSLFKERNFGGLVPNTPFIIPNRMKDNDLFFEVDNGNSFNILKRSGLSKMPMYRIDLTHTDRITEEDFDFLTIEDFYNSLQTNR